MIETKYKIEDDRFLFKADYDAGRNILYNHNEDKQTKEVFISENIGELNGRVKFDPSTIDDYVKKAIGAAFPITVEPIGFVFTYDDLEARKALIGDVKFNDIVAKYPRLIKKLHQLGKKTQVIYKVETRHDFNTGEQTTRVIFDNTAENWWSSDDTPAYDTNEIFTPEEQESFNQSLKDMVYVNPIERHIWQTINMMIKID